MSDFTRRATIRATALALAGAAVAGMLSDTSTKENGKHKKQYIDFTIFTKTKGFDILDEASLEYGKLNVAHAQNDDKFAEFTLHKLTARKQLPHTISSPQIKAMGLSETEEFTISGKEDLTRLITATRENKLGIAAHPSEVDGHECGFKFTCSSDAPQR